MKKSILLFCAVVFTLTVSVSAQTSNDLRRALGRPATEVYRADPDVFITVNYDAQGEACDIQFAGSYLPAQRFADKLIPVKSRGRQLGPPVGLLAMDCCQSFAYEYEKLTVVTSSGLGQPVIRFVFKGRECAVRQPPIQPPPRFSSGVFIQAQPSGERGLVSGNANYVYRKYETTEPAVILELPEPELTPEAVASPEPGEMLIEATLAPSGEVKNILLRGSLRNGMAERAVAAARKIKFKPALLDSRPVPQRVYIKYSLQKCDGDRVCARAAETLEP